jgi:Holliday junction DNA helicase RuvB
MARPLETWHGVVGQTDAIRSLRDHCGGLIAKGGKVLPCVCLAGPSGMGKEAIAACISKEMSTKFLPMYCSSQTKDWQMARHLRRIGSVGDVVFLDDVHQLQDSALEIIHLAIDGKRIPAFDRGNCQIQDDDHIGEFLRDIPAFNLVVATDKPGLIPSILKRRLALRFVLRPYTVAEMRTVVSNRASEIGLPITPNAVTRVAEASRGIPRMAGHILQSLKILGDGSEMTKTTVSAHLDSIGIDSGNLTESDRRYLSFMSQVNRHVELGELSLFLGLDEASIIQDVEVFLVQKGFILVENHTRLLTDIGRKFVKTKKWNLRNEDDGDKDAERAVK